MKITDSKILEKCYQAYLGEDKQLLDSFFIADKAKLTFGLVNCEGEKKEREELEFFFSLKSVLQYGYLPCDKCKPLDSAFNPGEQVKLVLGMVIANPKTKIQDFQLRELGISPESLRIWFKSNYGITFHTYQRMFRVNLGFRELLEDRNEANEPGISENQSLKGFGYTNQAGLKTDNPSVILLERVSTPIGPMFLGATSNGICMLEFTDRKMLETEFKDLQKRLKSTISLGQNEHILQAKSQLSEYFNGTRKSFSVPLDTPGTDFQNVVWNSLHEVPFGKTTSYQAQSIKLENPKGIRAIASANGHNRISIIIPCHRVIGKDGSLTGYGGGLDRKRWLLDFEKKVSK